MNQVIQELFGKWLNLLYHIQRKAKVTQNILTRFTDRKGTPGYLSVHEHYLVQSESKRMPLTNKSCL